MALNQFFDEYEDRAGNPLHWGRASADGAPFRGNPPLMSEHELDDRVVKVGEIHVDIFDINDQDQRQVYMSVLDRIASGWYRLVHLERFIFGTTCHYVEWEEFYCEDGTPARLTNARTLEDAIKQLNTQKGNRGGGSPAGNLFGSRHKKPNS